MSPLSGPISPWNLVPLPLPLPHEPKSQNHRECGVMTQKVDWSLLPRARLTPRCSLTTRLPRPPKSYQFYEDKNWQPPERVTPPATQVNASIDRHGHHLGVRRGGDGDLGLYLARRAVMRIIR